jgi:hypothetical protein
MGLKAAFNLTPYASEPYRDAVKCDAVKSFSVCGAQADLINLLFNSPSFVFGY